MIARILQKNRETIEGLTPDTQKNTKDVFRYDVDLNLKLKADKVSATLHRHFIIRPTGSDLSWEHGDPTLGARYFRWQWEITMAFWAGSGKDKQWPGLKAICQDADKICWKLTQLGPAGLTDSRATPLDDGDDQGSQLEQSIKSTEITEQAPGFFVLKIGLQTTHERQWG